MSDGPSDQELEIARLEEEIPDLERRGDHLRRSIRAMSIEIEVYRSPRNVLARPDPRGADAADWTVRSFFFGVVAGACFWLLTKVFR